MAVRATRPKGPPTLAQVSDTLWEHMERCDVRAEETANRIGAVKAAVKAVSDKLDEFNRTAWKAVGAVSLTILGAGAVVLAQNYVQHQQTERSQAQVAEQAASTVLNEPQFEIALSRALAKQPAK